jgi:hypothetical protein
MCYHDPGGSRPTEQNAEFRICFISLPKPGYNPKVLAEVLNVRRLLNVMRHLQD